MKPKEPKKEPPKKKDKKLTQKAKARFRSPTIPLNRIYAHLRRTNRLGENVVEIVGEGDDKKLQVVKRTYMPIALHIERTHNRSERDPSYTLFLKGVCAERKGEFRFDLHYIDYDDGDISSGITLRERSMCWESKRGFVNKHLENFYYGFNYDTNPKMGKKEKIKIRKSVRGKARKRLFEMVINTARKILDDYGEEKTLPLVYHEHPGGIRRVYPNAKEVLWKMGRVSKKKAG